MNFRQAHGSLEVIADADTAAAKAGLSDDPSVLYGALLTPAGR
jgi:hypothetical protein